MEVVGVRHIFKRLQLNYGIRYEHYIGDGNCKGFETACAEKLYGADFEIKKMECVGHVHKRMGTRLKNYKQKNAKQILEDDKTIRGRGRLTDATINTLLLYYGMAQEGRRNAQKGVAAMKDAIWAEFSHIGSTDEAPRHALCPADIDSWCKYKLSQIKKLHTNMQNTHTYL